MPKASGGAVNGANNSTQSQQETQTNAIVKKNYEVLVKFARFFREKGDQ